jgi:hypothetical protein
MKYLKTYNESIEEDDKWNVMKYGNSIAVYYNNIIVGFDDEEIGKDEEVKYETYTVDVVFNIHKFEKLTVYVVDFIETLFDNKEDAIKKISEKIAHELYLQNFTIKD